MKVAVFSSVFGCSSTQEVPVDSYQQPSNKQILVPNLTLQKLIEEKQLALDYESSKLLHKAEAEANFFLSQIQTAKTTYGQAVEQTCKSFEKGAFCNTKERTEFFTRTTSPRTRLSSAERREIQKNIAAGKFEAIKESPEAIIGVMSRLSRSAISNAIQSVLRSEACFSTSLYYAAGYVAESLLPGSDQMSFVTSLYSKGANCSNDEASARSAFRLALFYMDDKRCSEAVPLFSKVLAQDSLRALHSRSLYWSLRCQAGGPDLHLVEEAYQSSPLSFHGLLGLQDAGIDLYERIQRNAEPVVVGRSLNSTLTSQVLRVSEFMIINDQKRAAKNLLLSLSFDEIYKESPELAIYISYLFHRLEEGLLKFQTLATVLSRNPHLKTPTTMKLFYPKWHFERVEKYAKAVNLDPYLVMALIRQESAFHVNARSRARAMGLMQVLPSTARTVDRRVKRNQLFDPDTNVRIGTQYLARGLKRFDGNVHVTLAAYNAGGGIVSTWLKRYPMQDDLVFSDLIPYRETREYIGSIMRNYYWYKALYENNAVPLRSEGPSKKVDMPLTPGDETPTLIDVIPPIAIEEEPEVTPEAGAEGEIEGASDIQVEEPIP